MSKLLIQPVLAVTFVALGLLALGYAQRHGYLTSGTEHEVSTEATSSDVLYICPMVCVPPSTEPGKCPVCGMDLKPQKVSGDSKDLYGLTLNRASIRISNIQTSVAQLKPVTDRIQAVGEIGYDEGTLATISAYVDGRIEKLFADYVGYRVGKDEKLAVLFSPELYVSQVALFQARKLMDENRSTDQRIIESNRRFYASSRQRLIELGLSEKQIEEIEKQGEPDNRIMINSPIEGTVIEKLVDEGRYVKTGQPLLKVADLGTVWLVLQLFPDDAARVRFGQKVSISVQSLPNRKFSGRVAFVEPTLNRASQSINVRVVIPNPDGMLKIGDYATAEILVDLSAGGEQRNPIYDPELAGKWISPRHPHVIRDEPGKCPLCDLDLVPTSEFGFSQLPVAAPMFVVVPRSAVLSVGDHHVAYVETRRGRFEYREVQVGRVVGDEVVIESGIEAGEFVVSKATMLLDSSFNMANKPSLIDPERARPEKPPVEDPFDDPEVIKALEKFTDAEKESIRQQQICPIGKQILGSMGPPLKVDLGDRAVWVCCKGCVDNAKENPEQTWATMQQLKAERSRSVAGVDHEEIDRALAELSEADQIKALAQEICPVAETVLGSMGTPLKVTVLGQEVFLCCKACQKKIEADPQKYLEYLAARNAGKKGSARKQNAADSVSDPDPVLPAGKTGQTPDQGHRTGGAESADGPGRHEGLPKLRLPEMKLPRMASPKDTGQKDRAKSIPSANASEEKKVDPEKLPKLAPPKF